MTSHFNVRCLPVLVHCLQRTRYIHGSFTWVSSEGFAGTPFSISPKTDWPGTGSFSTSSARRGWPGVGASGGVFIVSSMVGVRGCGSSGSEGIVAMGWLLTISVTSAIRVTSSLCISWEHPIFNSIAHNTFGPYRFGVPRHLGSATHGEDWTSIRNLALPWTCESIFGPSPRVCPLTAIFLMQS